MSGDVLNIDSSFNNGHFIDSESFTFEVDLILKTMYKGFKDKATKEEILKRIEQEYENSNIDADVERSK